MKNSQKLSCVNDPIRVSCRVCECMYVYVFSSLFVNITHKFISHWCGVRPMFCTLLLFTLNNGS